VKQYFSKEFYEYQIKELTDSTLAMKIQKGGFAYHYAEQRK
jgi:hypothetical protein